MPGSTNKMNLPYPLGNETADVAGDIQRLAEAVDANAAPSAHKTQHATGGADALAPGDIGAASAADLAAHLADTVQNGVHGINEVQGETTFASTSGRTVSHSLGHTNYIVNVVPIQDTGGDLGDVFISKASNAFTIYNTGGFTGSFRYQLMT